MLPGAGTPSACAQPRRSSDARAFQCRTCWSKHSTKGVAIGNCILRNHCILPRRQGATRVGKVCLTLCACKSARYSQDDSSQSASYSLRQLAHEWGYWHALTHRARTLPSSCAHRCRRLSAQRTWALYITLLSLTRTAINQALHLPSKTR